MGDFNRLDDWFVASRVHGGGLPFARPAAAEVVPNFLFAVFVIADDRAVEARVFNLAFDHLLAPRPQLTVAGHAALQADVLPLQIAGDLANDDLAVRTIFLLLDDFVL